MNLNIPNIIHPTYEYTDEINTTISWLNNLNSKYASFDFESASKYNTQESLILQKKIKNKEPLNNTINDYKIAFTNGLSYPADTVLTHLGFSNNENHGKVIILLDNKVLDIVLNFLIETDITQIWHNCLFDFKYLKYYKNKLPKKYVDTKLISKNIYNNADNFLGSVSLKKLMKPYYGEWEKEKVEFLVENAYDNRMLQYTATDVCATYKLYELLLKGEI